MSRRPAHKLAHATCPYGQSNWADCDAASAHRYGLCVAMVDAKPEPHPCTRWAQDAEGYCTQHFIARFEEDRKRAAEAVKQLQLTEAIDAFIAKVAEHPSMFDRPGFTMSTQAESTRGLKGVPVTAVRVAPTKVGVAAPQAPGDGLPRKRRLPHRIDG